MIRCTLRSITFNTFTIRYILGSCLLSPLSMPFELSPDVIYRIQNVLYPASYLSAGFEPTLHDGTEVVCMPDDNTDNKQQVRRASGFTTIDTNFLQTSSGGSTAILKADTTTFRVYTMNAICHSHRRLLSVCSPLLLLLRHSGYIGSLILMTLAPPRKSYEPNSVPKYDRCCKP